MFNGTYYRQIFGLPMGSPLSPILAEILMDVILDDINKKIKEELDIDIVCLCKYVDDLFLCIPFDKTDEVLGLFNSVNTHIQFTYEQEANCRLPFLDMLVIREPSKNQLRTDWFMKPVASGRMLNYLSYHPLSQKINSATGLMHRVLTLSNSVYWSKNRTIVFDLLRKNNYPDGLINRWWNKIYNKTRNIRDGTIMVDSRCGEERSDGNTYCSMAYVKGVSEKI